jgi:uncharacterized protein (DUF885 family)
MIRFNVYLFLLFFLSACASISQKDDKGFNWKKASAKLTREYAKSMGPLSPEWISGVGFSQFEHLTTPWSKELEQQNYLLSYKWKSKLERMLKTESHEEYRADIRILLDHVERTMRGIEFDREIGAISFMPISENVYLTLNELVYDNAPERKIKNALSRFGLIVRGDEEQLPLIAGFTAHVLNQMDKLHEKRMKGFWPSRREIETYLKDSESYIESLNELLLDTKSDEWKKDYENFKEQELQYREFVKKKILPYARSQEGLPEAVYANILKEMGIDESPSELIEVAKRDYRVIYMRFSELAKDVAKIHNLSSSDPVSVVHYLTSKKISDQAELLKLYNEVNEELFQIVLREKLLSINERPNILIRFANKSEALSLPAPYFNNSPFFGKDKNKKSEFVITPADGGRDDFSFREAALNLTAHEAMPGHALQYHMMRERGTTLMRSWLAFNSVNVEGWGLFAEDLVFPYLSKEAQFITLQRRLWRVARMFLDPELNLGLINEKRVFEVFLDELGFSKLFAESEFRRYSYIMPGQANSYYFGYKRLMKMKEKVSDPLCFNDAILNFGVLPLEEIASRIDRLSCK